MYKVDDLVVYPAQGVGKINRIDTKTIGGVSCDIYIVGIQSNNITLMVPVKNAGNVGLRQLVDKEKAVDILESLKNDSGKNVYVGQNWNRRFRKYSDKMKSPDLGVVAEVLRELLVIGRDKELSYGERRLQEQLARSAARKQEITLRLESRRQAAQALKQNLEELKQQQQTLAGQVQAFSLQKEELQKEAEGLKAQINTLSSSLYEIKIKKNNVELDLKSTDFEYRSLLDNEGKRNEQIASSNARLKSLADEKLSTQAKLSAERDNLARLELDEHKLRGEVEALKKEFDEKTAALNASKKQVSELQIKKNDLENALSNARRQRTTVVNNLFESWNITPEEAAMNFGDKPVDYDRVKMMRKRIENMGAVNMTAPEEYDALTERHTFLKTQIGDLDGAKKDLKSAINKINQTTRENFRYTFEQVRMHFKNIYQTLFRGGECDLVLTQPENLLETGIEIYAQPPGKKLLNISSMSGGEKTLTALSLLFAFFTHNPSPFCIMDEADAALDEANVERYVNLIKEFSKTTQFIVVTHNKRTMESARMLYGITMEESGVSKVMSVNLEDRSVAGMQKKEEIESLAEA